VALKPTSSEVTVVNGNSVYKTKAEAESGMKAIKSVARTERAEDKKALGLAAVQPAPIAVG
jgi:uncharacterized protein YegP (UPF0339 family)